MWIDNYDDPEEMDQYIARQIEIQQESIQRWQESGARFWFGQEVEVLPLDPTFSIWIGKIDDVMICSDGIIYAIETEMSVIKGIREEQICPLYGRLSQDPERYAAYLRLSKQCYPHYYPESL